MDRMAWQAFGHQSRRRHRARGDQEVETRMAFGESLDQRKDRKAFADRRAVEPQQRAVWPGNRAFAPPLIKPRGVLFAPFDAPFEGDIGHGFQKSSGSAVSFEGPRSLLRHERLHRSIRSPRSTRADQTSTFAASDGDL